MAFCAAASPFESHSNSSEKKSAFQHGDKETPNSDGMDKLKRLAEHENCAVTDVARDGNCMFSALALQLKRFEPDQIGSALSAEDIRAELVAYIREHLEMVRPWEWHYASS